MFGIFKPYPNLIAAMSHRDDGDMKVKREIDGDPIVIGNKERFLTKLGMQPHEIIRPQLVHGRTVQIVGPHDAGMIVSQTDGLVTREANCYLSITVADCLPIFLYDPEHGIIGLLHAGWRGLDEGIITEGIRVIHEAGGNPEAIRAGIGPGIGPCHYEVDQERAARFRERTPEAIVSNNDSYFLNLPLIASVELQSAGVLPEHVETHPDCTYCNADTYFSHRYDKAETATPMIVVFGMLGQ